MYTIVIVDDEVWIAKGIANSCQWDQYHAKIELVSSQPKDALEFILANKPDIVFTDINMGDMTGIELMKQVRRANIPCEFVVISGYSEFEYAQQALQYGAAHYLLKPVDKNELNKVMANLMLTLNHKKSSDSSMVQIENLLIHNRITTHQELFGIYDKSIESSGFQTMIVEGNITQDTIEAILDGLPYVVLDIGSRKKGYFIHTEQDIYTKDMLHKIEGSGLKVGISGHFNLDTAPYHSFYEADLAFCNDFIYTEQRVFKYRKQEEKILILNRIFQTIVNGFSDMNHIINILEGLSQVIRENNYGMEEVCLIYHYFANTMQYFTDANHVDFKFKSYEEIYIEYKNIEDFVGFIQSSLIHYFQEDYKQLVPERKIEEILKYIEEHYNEQLFLSDLAERFFYNQTYLSDLIKKTLGKNFTEYVLELRVERAILLLKTTNTPVSTIATLLGFNDYCYFTKQFKRKVGVTPSAFRKEQSDEKI